MTIDLVKFTDELYEYLTAKFPDIPKAELLVNNAVAERDEWWRNDIEKRIGPRKYQKGVSKGEFDKGWTE